MKIAGIFAFSLAFVAFTGCSAAPLENSDGGDESAAVAEGLKTCTRAKPKCAAGYRCDVPEGQKRGTCVKEPQMCPMNYDPVCGVDGKTYGNACVAGVAGAAIAHPGACDEGGDACATRTNGAFVTFELGGDPGGSVATERFTVWSTNAEFIDESIRLKNAGEHRVPNFGKVIEGTDCNTGWSWHVDPADMGYADMTIELCDGRPSYLNDNLASWISDVGRYCPWSADVVAVDDRR